MNDGIALDRSRAQRTGVPEAVLCEGKSAADLQRILARLGDDAGPGSRPGPGPDAGPVLLTRLTTAQWEILDAASRARLDYDPLSRTALYGDPPPARDGGIGIVTAGTSDLPVAAEARRTLAWLGWEARLIADVGVAGVHRLLDRIDEIRTYTVVIAVAGMEGALFSVLGGLVPAPVIAVPTSVGYGVAADGRVALASALATCAPGVVVVNIDNGFGAAAAAAKILAVAPPDLPLT